MTEQIRTALSDAAARQLAVATRSVAQSESISPRWLTRLLNWVPVESGVFRLNKVVGKVQNEYGIAVRAGHPPDHPAIAAGHQTIYKNRNYGIT